jgi:hypothetical protein
MAGCRGKHVQLNCEMGSLASSAGYIIHLSLVRDTALEAWLSAVPD